LIINIAQFNNISSTEINCSSWKVQRYTWNLTPTGIRFICHGMFSHTRSGSNFYRSRHPRACNKLSPASQEYIIFRTRLRHRPT